MVGMLWRDGILASNNIFASAFALNALKNFIVLFTEGGL
jgi:hypothetical protein